MMPFMLPIMFGEHDNDVRAAAGILYLCKHDGTQFESISMPP
uniref:Uncharacterized protein n=1 Tax=Arundo donax TaxID=35708 RepID=A0A0A9BHB2_ARUDO